MSAADRELIAKKVLTISLLGNIMLSALKLIVGITAKSQAVIADAVHSFSDVLTTIIAMVGIKISSKPADFNHHYGHARVEAVASKIVALVLVFTAAGIMLSAWRSLQKPQLEIPEFSAAIVVAISIAIKEIMFQYAFRTGKRIDSLALVADAWHNRSDAISSVGALIGVLLARRGYSWADPAAGIVVSILVLKVGIDIYRKSIHQLIDTAPSLEVINVIKRVAINTKGVKSISDLKARMVGSFIHIDLQLCVDPNISVKNGHQIAEKAEINIKRELPQVREIMIHINPYDEL